MAENTFFLTGTFKLHLNDKDRRRIDVSLRRWRDMMEVALIQARQNERELLRCLTMWTSKDGTRSKLVLNKKQLHEFVKICCRGAEKHLHSSTAMSLIVTVEEMLSSYLNLYLEWIKKERKTPQPSFPKLAPINPDRVEKLRILALESSFRIATSGDEVSSLKEENLWRDALLRTKKNPLIPIYFGAATSGVEGQSHMGLIKRDDGRWFALLTLFPKGDKLGSPVERAQNRANRGETINPRGEKEFSPTPNARASIMVPLEFSGTSRIRGEKRSNEQMMLARGVPKSAEVFKRENGYFLHVAFEFPKREAISTTNILAIRRGITTLIAGAVISPDGKVLHRIKIEGKSLSATVSRIKEERAKKQAKGKSTKGDRRAARIAEHHLYSAAHQIRDVAVKWEAKIVLFDDQKGRIPNRFLQYRHFRKLHEILTYLAPEAGIAPSEERTIFGKWRTCLGCGWIPGDVVRHTEAEGTQCPGCLRVRDEEFDLATLLGMDVIRFQRHPEKEGRPSLNEFVKGLSLGAKK